MHELSLIGAEYVELMARKNKKGISALRILQNGAQRCHFECLQNSSRLMALLGPRGSRLGTGTTRNEQLHRELKSWSRNIYQSHEYRLRNTFRIFELTKLLTHSSAAYFPTLMQTRQQKLIAHIAGHIRNVSFFPPVLANPPASLLSLPLHRRSLKMCHTKNNITISLERKKKRQNNKRNWRKKKKASRRGKASSTDIFKRPRKK